ncbi:MAG: MFS transporter [Ignavibacteriales bacterium]|nr:MFS transporter [Ignavibacteriales bacterium]
MNPWRGLKNIPRNVWLVAFATLINRSGTMVIPFLALFLIKGRGINAADAGLVLTFYGAGSLITAPFVGKLSDKLGALRVMKISLTLTGVMLFFYPHITNYFLILGYTLIWSVIGEAFRPANLSFISSETKPEKRKTAFALNRLAINLGMSIGPVIGGFLSQINFHLLFYVDGITSLLAGGFLMIAKFGKTEDRKQNSEVRSNEIDVELNKDNHPSFSIEHQVSSLKHQESIFHNKRFLLFMLSLIPANIVFFQHIGAMPIFIVRDLGLRESVYGMLMAVNTVLIIFIEVPLNNAMSRWSDRKAAALGALLCGIGFGAMAFAHEIIFLIVTIVIWTFGEMIYFPASASYISLVSPEERRGEYMGYFQMTFSFALMTGPWIGTIVLENFGSVILWSAAFLLAALSAVMFLFFKEKRKEAHIN